MSPKQSRGPRAAPSHAEPGFRVLSVRAKPRSSVSALEEAPDGTWVARLRAPPVDGKANAELIALVAAHFGCARSDVSVMTGAGARLKWVKVTGLDAPR